MAGRKQRRGSLLLIGGKEQKDAEGAVLREVARRARGGPAVICTAASEQPDVVWASYEPVFRKLGLTHVAHLRVTRREQAEDTRAATLVSRAGLVFLSGGDQVNLTSRIAGTVVFNAIRDVYLRGGVVAGTLAGASALGQTMPVSHPGSEHKVGAAFYLVHGFVCLTTS